jgi:hypothetical protein
MANFTASGEPRFQAPPTPFRTEIKGSPAISTKAGFRQFEWIARVTEAAPSPDNLEVGLIQNMIACSIDLLYTSGPGDSSPVKVKFEVSPLPILDSKLAGAVWMDGNFDFLGTNTLAASEILPPGFSHNLTSTSAGVQGGDDPGGRFPVRHLQQSTKLLRLVEEQLDFITWIAVRKKDSPANDVRSYEFVKNLPWMVRRKIVVHHNVTGTFAAAYTQNSTRMASAPGLGMGPKAPVLGPAIANNAGKFTGMVVPVP